MPKTLPGRQSGERGMHMILSWNLSQVFNVSAYDVTQVDEKSWVSVDKVIATSLSANKVDQDLIRKCIYLFQRAIVFHRH